jgi:hypothetical protein
MDIDYIENGNNSSSVKSGIISLEKLYKMLETETALECINVKSDAGKLYRNLTKELTNTIPLERGFYLWGNFNKKKFWTNLYLGKSGEGKVTSLNQRILEELRDERAFIVKHFHTEDEIKNKSSEVFLEMWDKQYHKHLPRNLKKYGTTHIVWVTFNMTDNKIIEEVENDLIESINPISNIRRTTPPTHLNEETINILKEFRSNIHQERQDLTFNLNMI